MRCPRSPAENRGAGRAQAGLLVQVSWGNRCVLCSAMRDDSDRVVRWLPRGSWHDGTGVRAACISVASGPVGLEPDDDDFEVGVPLASAVLSRGTSTLASGK